MTAGVQFSGSYPVPGDQFAIYIFYRNRWLGIAYGSSPRKALLRAIQLRGCLK